MKQIKAEEKIEGFVIQFEDGRMYKVKTDWYFERTRKDKQDYSFNSERNIWLIILNQEIDDAGAYMDSKLRTAVDNFAIILYKTLGVFSEWCVQFVKEAKENKMAKKDCVAYCRKVLPNLPSPISSQQSKSEEENTNDKKADLEKANTLLYALFDDYETKKLDPLEAVIDWVIKACHIPKHFPSIKKCLGDIRFVE